MTGVFKKSVKQLQNNETEIDTSKASPKKRYISPKEINKLLIN